MDTSYEEYTSIRNEMIERINTSKQLLWQAIAFFIAALAAGISLKIVPFQYNIFAVHSILFFDFSASLILLGLVLILLTTAAKSGENIRQIVSISSYIKVFFENNPKIKKHKWMAWETANNSISATNIDRGKASKFYKSPFYNEYSIMSFIAIVLYVLFAASSILNIYKELTLLVLTLISILYAILLISGMYMVHKIYKISNIKNNMMEMGRYCIESYIFFGYKKGIFTKNDAAKIKNNIFIIQTEGASKKAVPFQDFKS